MKCELCGTNFRKIETFLVCANGHTIQNTTFVANDNEELMFHPKGKKVRSKKSERKCYRSSGCAVQKLILIKFVFEEAKTFFDIKSDDVFKYFCNFFEFHYGKLVSCLNIHQYTILGLVYLSKRSELEKQGQPYFFSDFIAEFKKFGLHARLVLIKNRFPALMPVALEFISMPINRYSICYLNAFIERLTNSFIVAYPFKFNRAQDSGVHLEAIETAKYNLRSLFRNDYEVIKPYFDDICLTLGVQKTDDLEHYFKKFVYTFNPFKVMMPEYEIPIFIAQYFNNRNEFENFPIEAMVLSYLRYSKYNFIQIIKIKAAQLRAAISPERLFSKYKTRGRGRFRCLRSAIDFVDMFKKYRIASKTQETDTDANS